MIWLLVVVAYLATGFCCGRLVFVRELGDSDRTKTRYGCVEWTGAFTRAVWGSISMTLVWPVFGPFYLMMNETPHERLEKQKRETRELEVRLEDLSRQAQSVLKLPKITEHP